MPSLGTWGEILIILITALIVIGPKDIPKTLKMIGRWVYKVRNFSQHVRSYVDELPSKLSVTILCHQLEITNVMNNTAQIKYFPGQDA